MLLFTFHCTESYYSPLQPGQTLSADQPEGNGTGLVWDDQGHVVTNYHVLGSVLRNYRPGAQRNNPLRVARVTLLGRAQHSASLCITDSE